MFECKCFSLAARSSWPPVQATTRKVRILDVSYNASNNELVSSVACTQLAFRLAVACLSHRHRPSNGQI